MEKLTIAENAQSELISKIQNMQSELDEAGEKCIRMDIITSALTTNQQKLERMTNELNQLKTENEQLKNTRLEELRPASSTTSMMQGGVADSTEQPLLSSRKRNFWFFNFLIDIF